MAARIFERGALYDNGCDFFDLGGNYVMRLTAKAAKEVCKEATKRRLFIGRIEGGHWLKPGFRPDGSTTWDSKTDLEAAGKFKENNELAVQNIDEDAGEGYDAFIITIVKQAE